MGNTIISDADEENAVRRIAGGFLGVEPETVERMTFGHRSRTYQTTVSKQSVIVRTNAKPETFVTTAANIGTLNGLGLPVPQVLASDFTLREYPFAYMALKSIPGRDLRYELGSMNRSHMTTLAEQLTDYQKRVGTLPRGKGFGYAGIGESAPHQSWIDVIAGELPENPPIAEPLRTWHSILTSLIRKHEKYLRSVLATCFLDDITVKNVIVKDGILQGLIDFDCVCYGDPLWWIGLTAAGIVSDVGSAELFYVNELCRIYGLTDEQRQIAALYCAMHAFSFVGRADGSENEDWRERMRGHVEEWIGDAKRV